MPQITVGIGECAVSSNADCTLVTYGLGSCIAVAAWDPQTRCAGLLHFMFPDSTADPGRFRDNPYLFADTGIRAMVHLLSRRRSVPENLVLRAAGGASVMQGPSLFNIGRRNYESMRQVLADAKLALHSEDIGGSASRTMRLDAATGRCRVEQDGRVIELSAAILTERRRR